MTITKLYFFYFRFWFLPQFFLRGLTWAVLYVWPSPPTPGLPLQLLTRNSCIQSDRPEPPPPLRERSHMTSADEGGGMENGNADGCCSFLHSERLFDFLLQCH